MAPLLESSEAGDHVLRTLSIRGTSYRAAICLPTLGTRWDLFLARPHRIFTIGHCSLSERDQTSDSLVQTLEFPQWVLHVPFLHHIHP